MLFRPTTLPHPQSGRSFGLATTLPCEGVHALSRRRAPSDITACPPGRRHEHERWVDRPRPSLSLPVSPRPVLYSSASADHLRAHRPHPDFRGHVPPRRSTPLPDRRPELPTFRWGPPYADRLWPRRADQIRSVRSNAAIGRTTIEDGRPRTPAWRSVSHEL